MLLFGVCEKRRNIHYPPQSKVKYLRTERELCDANARRKMVRESTHELPKYINVCCIRWRVMKYLYVVGISSGGISSVEKHFFQLYREVGIIPLVWCRRCCCCCYSKYNFYISVIENHVDVGGYGPLTNCTAPSAPRYLSPRQRSR